MSKPKSILDIQDPAFFRNLMQPESSKSYDNCVPRSRDASPMKILSNKAEMILDTDGLDNKLFLS